MADAPPLAPDRMEAVMAAVSRSVRTAVSDPARPLTAWQLTAALLDIHPDYVDRRVRDELVRPGRERPGWQWLALVAGLYDRERLRAHRDTVNTRLMLLGLARLEEELDALLRRYRGHRQLEAKLGFPLAGVVRPWARAAAPTQLLPIWELGYDTFLNCCAIDRRGRRLAAGANDGALVLWDLATGRRQAVLPGDGKVRDVAFSPDGSMLAAAGSELRLIDMRTLAPLPPIASFEEGAHTVRFSPDGRTLIVLPWAGMPMVVDPHDRQARILDLEARMNGCAFSPDGRAVATAGDDGTVRLWDVATGQETAVLEVGPGQVFQCAIGGGLLAAATTGGPALWRLENLEPVPIELQGGLAADCAFSPDGSLLAFAFPDGPLAVWDLELGVPRDSFEGGTLGCAFSGDGRLLVAWSSQAVRAWDAVSGAERAAVEAYPAQVALGSGLVAQAGSDAAEERGVAQVWEEVAQSQLPAVAADALGDEDLIGVQADAAALADVIAASGTEPPLSIGLFGDWGSGKSFLIRLVQAQVRRLGVRSQNADGDSSYCRYIRNVEFNAWQYAEGDLWASMVTHLFDELAKPEPAAGVSSAERAREQIAELEAALAQQSGVRERLDRARAQADQAAAARALRRWTWSLAGVEGDPELTETVGKARSVLGLLLPSRGAKLLAVALVLLVALVLAALLVVIGVDSLIATATSIVAAGAAAAGVAATAIDRVRALVDRLDAGARASDVQRAGLDAELAAARAAETALQTELTDLAAGRRVGRFAAERSHSDDYRAHLGVVSRIHDDFERMSDLLAQQRQRPGGTPEDSAEGEALPRIDRIVLYIDDLDRCPPRRVVEVLEAVHLILALPLFVVVLAVDPSWLLQSLRLHYSELLAGADGEEDWRSTPLHYVEKIIQVPFALEPMNRDSARSLVHGLLPLERAAVDGGPAPPPPPETDGTPAVETEPATPREREAAGGPPIAAPAPSLTPRTLGLTPAERDFAAEVAAALHTPRTIKKFTNLYRLLRARLDERSGELDAFLDDAGPDVPEYQAVLILITVVISFPDEASRLLIELLDPDGAASWREQVRATRYGSNARELAEFLSWSTRLATNGSSSSRRPFQRWAREVSRYSFETGQQVFARAG